MLYISDLNQSSPLARKFAVLEILMRFLFVRYRIYPGFGDNVYVIYTLHYQINVAHLIKVAQSQLRNFNKSCAPNKSSA